MSAQSNPQPKMLPETALPTPTPMTRRTPAPSPDQSPASADNRVRIDARSALMSALRLWLATRDGLLVNFSFSPDGNGKGLYSISDEALENARKSAGQMDKIKLIVVEYAELLTHHKVSTEDIISEALTDLLSAESPMFSLSIDSIPGTF